MKRFLRALVLVLCIVPCLFLFTGCFEEKSIKIKDISRTDFTDETVTYTITYEDNTTFSYTIPIENTVSIESIAKTGSVQNVDKYTIIMSNGQTFNFDVTNGVSISTIKYISSENGEDCYEVKYTNGTSDYFYIPQENADITIEELYETANTNNQYSSILEFIEEYLSLNVDTNSKTVATSKAILSAVNVTACYPSQSYYGTSGISVSRGAGVIYQFDEASDSAYIITNCHVVYSEGADSDGYADKVFAYVYGREGYPSQLYQNSAYDQDGNLAVDGGEYGIECEVIGASIQNDIAVLKAKKSDILKNSPNARAVDLADSETVALADDAIAIGNPQGEGMAVTCGTISVISEDISVSIDSSVATDLREFRIDTAVNSGNSGGGLFNNKGQLIGIVNAKATTDSSSVSDGVITEGMGYALPSNAVSAMADNMIYNYIENGGFGLKKVMIGITVYINSSIAIYDEDNLVTKIVEDVKVKEFKSGGIASNMGFKVEDQILSFYINDIEYKIDRMYQVVELMYKVRVGDVIKYKCLSGEEIAYYSHTVTAEDFTSNIV